MPLFVNIRKKIEALRALSPEDPKLVKKSESYSRLASFVFAVVVGQSLLKIISAGVSFAAFSTWVLVGSYFTVILSFVQYQRSLISDPYKTPIRLVIDMGGIQPVYVVLVTFFGDFNYVVWAYAAMFALYVAWGVLKALEYPNQLRRYAPRAAYPITSIVLAALYRPIVSACGYLAVIMSLVILYAFQPLKKLKAWARAV